MRRELVFAASSLAQIALYTVASATLGSPPSRADDPKGLRDQRYCEILLGSGGPLFPSQLEVYNTIGLNDCPDDLWRNLSADRIKQETQSKMVRLNGPRHWLIDGFKNAALQDPTIRRFEGLAMRKAGILHLSLSDLITQGKPYRLHYVGRKTTAVFLAGQPQFELIDDEGHVYFMQAYSQQKEDQSLATLPLLGSRLKLPRGWSFRVVILKNNFFLKAENDLATVTQDELENTYQFAPGATSDQF